MSLSPLSKRTMKKKGKKKALTLDELFNETASQTSASLSPHSSNKIVLTPLSSEACLKHGINPEILRKRTLESFYESNIDREVQCMKYEAYMQRREEMMNLVSAEKERLGRVTQSNYLQNMSCTMIPADILAQQELENSALVENEKKRLQKAQNQQKKELLQLLQFENERSRIMKEIEKKKERDAKKDEQKRREVQRREREAAENKRIKELRRKAQEDAELEMQRIAAQELHEREVMIMKEKERQQEIIKTRNRLLEEERNKKREEHKLQTMIRIKKQQKELQKRQLEREERERERQSRVEMIRKQEKEDFEARQKEIRDRISANQEAARRWQEKRKLDLLKKQREADELMKQREYEKQIERKKKQEKIVVRTQKKAFRLKMAKDNEEQRKEMVKKKFEDEEEYLSELNEMKQKRQLVEKERREMQDQLKRENVERIKRMHDYHRSKIEDKVKEGDKRIQEMLEKKHKLIEERKKAAYEAKRQKDKILGILEQSKTAGGRSIKKILTSLSIDETSKNGKKAKKGKFRSQSAGRLQGPPVERLGPRPYAPSLETRLAKSADQPRERFQSPYVSSNRKSSFNNAIKRTFC